MRALRIIIAAMGAASFAAGVAATDSAEVTDRREVDFKRSIVAYPYAMAPARAAAIRGGSSRLRRCMDRDQVRAALGAPDFVSQSFGYVDGIPVPNGTVWHYVFRREKPENVLDVQVSVWFDEDRRLSALTMTNDVTGVARLAPSEIESCAARPAKEHP